MWRPSGESATVLQRTEIAKDALQSCAVRLRDVDPEIETAVDEVGIGLTARGGLRDRRSGLAFGGA